MPELAPGLGSFTRFAALMMRHRGDVFAIANSDEYVRSLPAVRNVVEKAAVAVGGTTDPTWANPLASPDGRALAGPFAAATLQRSLLGRLDGTRSAAFDVQPIIQTERPVAAFVAQNAPKPVSASAFSALDPIRPRKAASIIVTSKELVRAMRPADMRELELSMVASVANAIDTMFVDGGGATDARPGSVFHPDNVETIIPSSGTTAAAIMVDLKAALTAAINSGDVTDWTWIMSQSTALSIAALRGTQGEFPFPGITPVGGTLLGLPVLTVNAMLPIGSPSERTIGLVNARRVVIADDSAVRIEHTEYATLQMDSAPSAGAQPLVSLWQANLTGLLCERFINWSVLPDAAILITGVNY